MASRPWCAALKCPAPRNCEGYISQNQGNQTIQNSVACCKILCNETAQTLLALKCGGATPATSVGIVLYFWCLVLAGWYIIAVGPFRRMKGLTFFVTAFASLVFNTGTGVFVTFVTSPFRVLQSLPAVGAMNVAVFFYYFSGFQYALGLAYEGAPLFVFINTAYTIGKVIPLDAEGPMFRANRIAVTMLVVAGLWILHSISYRLFGYRVDWRLEHYSRTSDYNEPLNQNFHMGAAQGHPTWRTPMGQSSSVILTVLAWSVLALVVQDLDKQGCRQDWFFYFMLCMAPILISLSVVWNVLNATRSKFVHLPTPQDSGGTFSKFLGAVSRLFGSQNNVGPFKTHYPGSNPYINLWVHRRDFRKWNQEVREEYVQAVALQRMGRNSMFVEKVPPERLKWTDKLVGFMAWFLAQAGLLMSFPAFSLLKIVSELCGILFECFHWKRLVETVVEEVDQSSLADEIDQCYVGRDLPAQPMNYQHLSDFHFLTSDNGRMVNLHTLFDNTGPAELYSLLR